MRLLSEFLVKNINNSRWILFRLTYKDVEIIRFSTQNFPTPIDEIKYSSALCIKMNYEGKFFFYTAKIICAVMVWKIKLTLLWFFIYLLFIFLIGLSCTSAHVPQSPFWWYKKDAVFSSVSPLKMETLFQD